MGTAHTVPATVLRNRVTLTRPALCVQEWQLVDHGAVEERQLADSSRQQWQVLGCGREDSSGLAAQAAADWSPLLARWAGAAAVSAAAALRAITIAHCGSGLTTRRGVYDLESHQQPEPVAAAVRILQGIVPAALGV